MYRSFNSLIANSVAGFAAVMFAGAVSAAGDDVRALQEQFAILNQEQQAIYQQFQMIQQLRRSNAEQGLPAIGGGPPGNYDDVVASRRAQVERDEAYARELRELYQRHQELEREKQPVLEGLRRLRNEKPRAPSPSPAPAPPPPGGAGLY